MRGEPGDPGTAVKVIAFLLNMASGGSEQSCRQPRSMSRSPNVSIVQERGSIQAASHGAILPSSKELPLVQMQLSFPRRTPFIILCINNDCKVQCELFCRKKVNHKKELSNETTATKVLLEFGRRAFPSEIRVRTLERFDLQKAVSLWEGFLPA